MRLQLCSITSWTPFITRQHKLGNIKMRTWDFHYSLDGVCGRYLLINLNITTSQHFFHGICFDFKVCFSLAEVFQLSFNSVFKYSSVSNEMKIFTMSQLFWGISSYVICRFKLFQKTKNTWVSLLCIKSFPSRSTPRSSTIYYQLQ